LMVNCGVYAGGRDGVLVVDRTGFKQPTYN